MRNPGSDTPPNGPRPAPAPAQSDDSALIAELYQDLASLPIEVSRKWEARLRAAAQSRPAVDVFEAYRTWPVGLRAKLSMQDLRQMSGWVAPGAAGKDGLQVPVTALYAASAKGTHFSETDGTEGKYWFISKFQTLEDLWTFEDARRVLLLAERDRLKTCDTCNDNGRVGGPSFYAPDEGGDPCPDCAPKAGIGDTALLDAIQRHHWKVAPTDQPTGGGDADIGWYVIEEDMAAPSGLRVVHEHATDNVRDAVACAIVTKRAAGGSQ